MTVLHTSNRKLTLSECAEPCRRFIAMVDYSEISMERRYLMYYYHDDDDDDDDDDMRWW